MAIRAVIFDLGGVVWDSPVIGLARYEDSVGLPHGTITGLNLRDPDTNAWARYERGEVDTAGFCELFEAEAARQGFRIDARRVLGALQGALRPDMLRAVDLLRAAGLRVAACTNNFAPLDRTDPDVAEFLGHFDVVAESSVERLRKPELAFYRLVLARLGVEAEQCVFLDDLGVNLKPARAMGLITIKVDDPATALRELAAVTGLADLLAR